MENENEPAEKGKKRNRKRTRGGNLHYHEHYHAANEPGHASADANALADGFTAEMHQADECKNMSHAVPTVTSDIGARYSADHNRHVHESGGAAEMAQSATAARGGGGSSSAGNYDAQRGGGRGRVAVGHGDLRQSNTDFSTVLATLRTARGNVQDLGFGPDSDVPGGFSHAGTVALRLFDARSQAGGYDGMAPVGGNPLRPVDHPARSSATADNGTHSSGSQEDACTTPRQSMKALDIMRETQRIIT